MPKTLTLSKPKMSKCDDGTRMVKWALLDENGAGYRISWTESAFDTDRPECMAFSCEYDKRGRCWTNYHEQAVSYNPDAALALRDVMVQLRKKYGYEYNTEIEVQLLPGEVVADGNR